MVGLAVLAAAPAWVSVTTAMSAGPGGTADPAVVVDAAPGSLAAAAASGPVASSGPPTPAAHSSRASPTPAGTASTPGRPDPDRRVGGAPGRGTLNGWSQALAPRLGLPWRALRAYGWTELVLGRTDPGCRLTWATLAGIGWVESRNGTGGPAVGGPPAGVGADDVVRPTILGPVLDGRGGRQALPATGRNSSGVAGHWARAVGPMQFLPSTWAVWGRSVDATGRGDPSNIDDAALAAGRLLCSVGDLGTGAGWQRAVLAYNHSLVYAADVSVAARWYAQSSLES